MYEPTGELNAQSAVRRLVLGDVTFTYVVDGAMAFAPSAFIPTSPAHFWREHPEMLDSHGHLAMSAGGLLVERRGHRTLIDAGLGDIQVATETLRFNSGAFLEVLAKLGIRPETIDVFALTHLHADHIGWAMHASEEELGTPVFPSARYVVAGNEWQSYDDSDTSHLESLRAQCHSIADGDEIAEGIHAIVTPGHTSGHTTYAITTTVGRLLAFGDAFHTPAQMAYPSWTWAADSQASLVPGARTRLLAELAQPNTYGFGGHFGDQVFGHIGPNTSDAPTWHPVATEVIAGPPKSL
jgi:glyoxylase-like metal-dependent hydrolase (beta-lactamase superfamily II)